MTPMLDFIVGVAVLWVALIVVVTLGAAVLAVARD